MINKTAMRSPSQLERQQIKLNFNNFYRKKYRKSQKSIPLNEDLDTLNIIIDRLEIQNEQDQKADDMQILQTIFREINQLRTLNVKFLKKFRDILHNSENHQKVFLNDKIIVDKNQESNDKGTDKKKTRIRKIKTINGEGKNSESETNKENQLADNQNKKQQFEMQSKSSIFGPKVCKINITKHKDFSQTDVIKRKNEKKNIINELKFKEERKMSTAMEGYQLTQISALQNQIQILKRQKQNFISKLESLTTQTKNLQKKNKNIEKQAQSKQLLYEKLQEDLPLTLNLNYQINYHEDQKQIYKTNSCKIRQQYDLKLQCLSIPPANQNKQDQESAIRQLQFIMISQQQMIQELQSKVAELKLKYSETLQVPQAKKKAKCRWAQL